MEMLGASALDIKNNTEISILILVGIILIIAIIVLTIIKKIKNK